MTIVFFSKSFIQPCFVFAYPPFKVICNANIQYIFVFVGHDINEVVVEEGHDLNNVILKSTLSFRTMREVIVRWIERNLLKINERPKKKPLKERLLLEEISRRFASLEMTTNAYRNEALSHQDTGIIALIFTSSSSKETKSIPRFIGQPFFTGETTNTCFGAISSKAL